jgi:uncharacterized protein (TIGR03546 family)
MILWFVRPLKLLVKSMRDLNSPRRIAAGVALGMMIGLVPKDNLTAVALGILLFALRVNLAAGSLSALAFLWVGLVFEPILDRIGFALLTWPVLEPVWSSLYRQPLVPWTDLNNTLVMGGLVLGLILCYPVYHVSSRCLVVFSEQWGSAILARLRKYRLAHIAAGVDFASAWSWRK